MIYNKSKEVINCKNCVHYWQHYDACGVTKMQAKRKNATTCNHRKEMVEFGNYYLTFEKFKNSINKP